MSVLSFGATGLEEVTNDDIAAMIGFISGFTMTAIQTSAPTGWTKNVTHNDKALRIVSGAASSGGSSPFTTAFASRSPAGSLSSDSLTIAQLAVHDHTYSGSTESGITSSGGTGAPRYVAFAGTAGVAGSGAAHTHAFTGTAMDFAVSYVDCIIITKD